MESRTENSIRNLKFGILNTIILAAVPFITRTVFIRILGKGYLGIDAVFINIINLIEIVNVGIGSAIIYSVYKPIAENNIEKCRTLFRLYRNCYWVMGTFVFIIGLCIIPFFDVILKNKPDIPENIYVIYAVILSGMCICYFFQDKQCILNAHQKSYVISKVKTIVYLVVNVLEIIFLIVTKKYMVYLVIQTSQNIIISVFCFIKAKKMYPQMFVKKVKPLEKDDKNKIVKNTAALVLNRAGSLIINCTDNLVISTFVGVGAVGVYSNYFALKNMVNTFTSIFTQSITASVGNLNAMDNRERLYDVFRHTFFINYIIHAFCSVCLFCLIEPFIKIWIGDSYLMGYPIAAIVTLNLYFIGIQKTAEQFKAACGLYWQDRFRVFIESIANIIISIILVKYMGVLGVLLGTFISNLFVTFWVEPYIVYKHALGKPVGIYFVQNAFYFAVTFIVTAVVYFTNEFIFGNKSGIVVFVLRAVVTAGLAMIMLTAVFFKNKYFKITVNMAFDMIKSRFIRK